MAPTEQHDVELPQISVTREIYIGEQGRRAIIGALLMLVILSLIGGLGAFR